MKAFLLAAGLGTRLRPLTESTPKCLVPILGRPLLEIWLLLLQQHGVYEVLINTHHLAERVEDFASGWRSDVKIHLAYEDRLAGSAGTIRRNWDFIENERDFFVCNADNLTDIDLGGLLRFHRQSRSLLTMGLFETTRPSECGIVETDATGWVQSFVEKPSQPRGCLANAGVYVMDRGIRSALPEDEPADIALDVIPRCLGRAYGWRWDGVLLDIGSPEAYAAAQGAAATRRDP